MGSIQLLIVSDEASSRLGLSKIFANKGSFVLLGTCGYEEAINKSISLQPDVILLDLPSNSPIIERFVIELREICSYSLIFTIIEIESAELLTALYFLGIDGCLPRGIMNGYMVKAIELGCRAGLFCFPKSIKSAFPFAGCYRVGDMTNTMVESNTPTTNLFKLQEKLTKREMEILELMAQNRSNRQIGSKLYISVTTVKTHISNILRKIGQKNRVDAIFYAYRMGLLKTTEFFDKDIDATN